LSLTTNVDKTPTLTSGIWKHAPRNRATTGVTADVTAVFRTHFQATRPLPDPDARVSGGMNEKATYRSEAAKVTVGSRIGLRPGARVAFLVDRMYGPGPGNDEDRRSHVITTESDVHGTG
jgi:hypothetical protein